MEAQRGSWVILFVQDGIGGLDYTVNTVLKLVCTGQVFQMAPETFDGVEIGTIGWQPDHPDPMFEQTESRQGGSALVVGGVVHHQHHPSGRINVDQEMLEKSDKVGTVLCLGYRPTDLIRTPVVATKEDRRVGKECRSRWSPYH